MNFFVACAKGLEYLLVDELTALGAQKASAAVAGVRVEGDMATALRAVMHSRLASRVLWPLLEFDCRNENDLYQAVLQIRWSEHTESDAALWIDSHVSGPELTHARYASQRVKDAIADQMRAETGERPSIDGENPDLRIDLVVRKGKGILSIDLGGSLHLRGWRRGQGVAPIKETLACALLLRGKWPTRYAEGGDLLDPMCGSGTLLIEGALMAADVAPGLRRYSKQAPTRWKQLDQALWREILDDAGQRAQKGLASLRPCFFGCDVDGRMVGVAQANAHEANVSEVITLEPLAIKNLSSWREQFASVPGLVVSNPPYDQRLEADEALYKMVGSALIEAVPTWRAVLLCGSSELAFATGLRASKRYQIFNGALECTLLIADPVFTPRPERSEQPRVLSEGAQMVCNRIQKNQRRLKSWLKQSGVTCYRVYDADLPEYSAAIDVYENADDPGDVYLQVQEYQAPITVNENDARRRFGEILDAARAAFQVDKSHVAIKTRVRAKGGSKYGQTGASGAPLIVLEGSAKFEVQLFEYLDTGLFLDHRPLRLKMAKQSQDKDFLNLFAYTGTASVHAALAGASSTTSVDLSATYLEWTARNFKLNGMGGNDHRLIQADVMDWLRAERSQYDIIFCDPPTFSNSARADDFDVQKDHVELISLALQRLRPGGVLYFSNNFRKFKLDSEAIERMAHCKEISAISIDPDFERNQKIHRAWQIQPK